MKIKHLILGGITVIIGSTILVTAAKSAEITKEQEGVICQLKDTVERQNRDGNKLVFLPLLGRVSEGIETRFTAKLIAEVNYAIMGACDDNCNEFNLTLNNTNGERIAFGDRQDGMPIISFTPPFSSDYQITVRIDECRAENCEFGMLLFVPQEVEVATASKVPEDLYLFQLCSQ
ncbi:MAG: hypothetical protein F6K35_46145 [Okeania sp. SIO2H7]|nr:hypothetical protein [Okeania sp. SIO2H7]